MAYFPAFVKLDNKKILIVGGGKIAYEKLGHLLDFTPSISLIAKEFCDDIISVIEDNTLEYDQRAYRTGDIKGFDIIIIAVDNLSLQAEIYGESRQYRSLCNAVDSVDYCDFIFPSYIKKGDLTLAISTSGASPALAKQLRIYLQKIIPDSITEFLSEMKSLRKNLPKGKERMLLLEEKAKKYVERFER